MTNKYQELRDTFSALGIYLVGTEHGGVLRTSLWRELSQLILNLHGDTKTAVVEPTPDTYGLAELYKFYLGKTNDQEAALNLVRWHVDLLVAKQEPMATLKPVVNNVTLRDDVKNTLLW